MYDFIRNIFFFSKLHHIENSETKKRITNRLLRNQPEKKTKQIKAIMTNKRYKTCYNEAIVGIECL